MVAGRWDICKLLVGQKNLPAVYNAGRFITRISHELLSRDHEDGRATRSAGACAACRATRPAVPRDWFRGVPERYVAGADT